MALGRKRKTADSTTAATVETGAVDPAATVVDSARTRGSKPAPPEPPTAELPPSLGEIEAPVEPARRSAITDHDMEW